MTAASAWFETYRGTVRPAECDVLGHLNIGAFIAKFDEANHHVAHRLGLTPSRRNAEFVAFVGSRIHTKFFRELFAGDIIVCRSGLIAAEDPLIHYVTEMADAVSDEVVARFEEIACCFDLQGRRACAFPAIVCETLATMPRVDLGAPAALSFNE